MTKYKRRYNDFLRWAWCESDYLVDGDVPMPVIKYSDEEDYDYIEAQFRAELLSVQIEMLEAYITEEGI